MVKVGLLLNDSGFENKKLDNPWEGNPGIGGTQYCFIMLATTLAEMSDYEVICFHFDKSNHLISLVESVIVKDDIDAIKKAKKLNVDVFLMKSPTDEDVFNEIDYQILVEADFLVNVMEDGLSKEAALKAYHSIFKTTCGKMICREMFDIGVR